MILLNIIYKKTIETIKKSIDRLLRSLNYSYLTLMFLKFFCEQKVNDIWIQEGKRFKAVYPNYPNKGRSPFALNQ